MTIYVLICLCLSLAGMAGLQFFYLAYLERIEYEHKKRIHELERLNRQISQKLFDAQLQIKEQTELLEAVYEDYEGDEDVWADVIEDRKPI